MAKQCVNALNGLLSFLPLGGNAMNYEKEVCQRPERASFISTLETSCFLLTSIRVSTP